MGETALHMHGIPSMPRVDAIWNSARYQHEYRRLEALEADRQFCRHDVRHLLDTARIMWALSLERELGLSRDLVYATALLHDIGKAEQYEHGEPHERAGARLAGEILDALPAPQRFCDEERAAICTAIRGHRRLRSDATPLEELLYRADKASRPCFACASAVRGACAWSDEKKNLSIAV